MAAHRTPRSKVASVLASMVVAASLAFAPAALAASEDAEVQHDARTMGYPSENQSQIQMEGGTALTWLSFVALAIVGLSALFKDAKRSHLD